MQKLVQRIGDSVRVIRKDDTFEGFVQDASPSPGDGVLLNNSYIFRQGIRTNKSEKYLVLPVEKEGVTTLPEVVGTENFNKDFKLLSHQRGVRERKRLPEALDEQVVGLGTLLFILIGRIEDTAIVRAELKHSAYREVVLDPTMDRHVRIQDEAIRVREIADEERIWEDLVALRGDNGHDESLRQALGVALDALQSDMYAYLRLPGPSDAAGDAVVDEVRGVLEEQRDQYAQALERCDGDANKDPEAFNEVLRIAYNFSSDALTFIRLLVSICDLKPIVLWCTIGEHYRLAEAFRQLPWVRSFQKPSLRGYVNTIGDARNSAFHNLFPFRKSLEVQLPDASLQEVTLRLFSEHSKRKENQLRYQDKEFVEVLTEFTRARRRDVQPRFWRQNLEIMDATVDLLDGFGDTLRILSELSR